jgi:hypothetical protein
MYGRLAAGPVSVRREADAPAGCTQKKDLQIAGLYKAAEGIRTLDLLHGKQNVSFPLALEIPCKPAGSRVWVSSCDSPAFTGSSRGFRHPMGTQQPYGGRPHWSSSRTSSLILRAMSSRIALTSSSGRPAGSWRSQSKTHHDRTRHIGYGVWFLRETVCDRPDPGFPLCFSKPEARVRGGRIDASIFGRLCRRVHSYGRVRIHQGAATAASRPRARRRLR